MRIIYNVTINAVASVFTFYIKLICFMVINERSVAIAKHQQATSNILLVLYEYKEKDSADELNRVM